MIGTGARTPLLFAAYALMAIEVWRGVWLVVETDSWWSPTQFGFDSALVVLALVIAIMSGADARPLAVLAGILAAWTAAGAAWIWFEDSWRDELPSRLTSSVLSALTALLIAVLAVLTGRRVQEVSQST
jgi:hypothetical protein